MYPGRFVELVLRASSSDCEVTLAQIAEALELGEIGTLEKVTRIRSALESFNLHVLPGFDKGEMETVRVCGLVDRSKSDLRQDLRGEGPRCEYKASLSFDHDKFSLKQDLDAKYYQNEELQFAVLKTIAAFLNSSGGMLFVGVRNDGTICGLKPDLQYCKTADIDGWELKLRDLIKTNFYEGDQVNNYISVEFDAEGDDHFCRISVIAKSRLSFVKWLKKDRYALFVRQGNRTTELAIQDVEDFLLNRIGKTHNA